MKQKDLLKEISLCIKRFEYYFSIAEGETFIYDDSINITNEKSCEYKFKSYFSYLGKSSHMNKDIKEINIDDKEKNSNIDKENNKSESLLGKKRYFQNLKGNNYGDTCTKNYNSFN